MTLEDLRNQIDQVDNQLLGLLNARMEVVKQVGELKRSTQTGIYRPEREKSIVDRLDKMSNGLLSREAIEAIFLEIFAVARNIELPERVAFLGPEGSFTHQAAESRFGSMSEYDALPTIRSIFEAVETGRAKFGVVPIENNQEGIVFETIDQLNQKDINIAAECIIPVHFTFATKAERLSEIKKVCSKDIAFRQCKKFLDDYFGTSVEFVPVESTSKAAKMAAEDPKVAAICSQIAAKIFGVPVLFDNIQDSSVNRTRFYILAKNFKNQVSGNDKTTILVNFPDSDKPGTLFKFLREFETYEINITKLTSHPSREGANFGFWFLMEFEGHFEEPKIQKILKERASEIKWLGSYVKLI
ncbi:MAG: chorismate mutase [Spirosomataceae bacterium]